MYSVQKMLGQKFDIEQIKRQCEISLWHHTVSSRNKVCFINKEPKELESQKCTQYFYDNVLCLMWWRKSGFSRARGALKINLLGVNLPKKEVLLTDILPNKLIQAISERNACGTLDEKRIHEDTHTK